MKMSIREQRGMGLLWKIANQWILLQSYSYRSATTMTPRSEFLLNLLDNR
jgi:hypothetical protein